MVTYLCTDGKSKPMTVTNDERQNCLEDESNECVEAKNQTVI